MAVTLDARVQQKTATEAEWLANPLELLKGEQAFVINSEGQPINFKIGDGTKTFAQLPYVVDFSQILIEEAPAPGGTLPEPDAAGRLIVLPAGTYTQPDSSTLIAPDDSFSVYFWDGDKWSLNLSIPISFDPEGLATIEYVDSLTKISEEYEEAIGNTNVATSTILDNFTRIMPVQFSRDVIIDRFSIRMTAAFTGHFKLTSGTGNDRTLLFTQSVNSADAVNSGTLYTFDLSSYNISAPAGSAPTFRRSSGGSLQTTPNTPGVLEFNGNPLTVGAVTTYTPSTTGFHIQVVGKYVEEETVKEEILNLQSSIIDVEQEQQDLSEKIDGLSGTIYVWDNVNLQNYISNDVGQYSSSSFVRIGNGMKQLPNTVIDGYRTNLRLSATVETVRFQVYKRLTSNANLTNRPGDSTIPGGDVNLFDNIDKIKGVDFTFVNTSSDVLFDIAFPTPITYDPASEILIVYIKAYDVNGARVTIGNIRNNGVTISEPYIRGWYSTNAGSDTAADNLTTSGVTFNRIFYGRQLANKIDKNSNSITELSTRVTNIENAETPLTDRAIISSQVVGSNVQITGNYFNNGRIIPINSSVSILNPGTGQSTINNYQLRYDTQTDFTGNDNAYLGRRNITSVVVTRVSDSVVLTQGVDYNLTSTGKLVGLINTAAIPVNVVVNWQKIRYDIVQIDAWTNVTSVVPPAITVKRGAERDFEPQEWIPEPDSGTEKILTIRVENTASVEIFDSYKYKELIHFDWIKDFDYLVNINRSRISKTIGKISRGETITLGVYTDSRGAWQGGGNLPANYAPNGAARDRPEYLTSDYPADTVNKLTKYDWGDGAGQVHVKGSMHWQLALAIERLTGNVVDVPNGTYLNFGIGGTDSRNIVDGGLWPARLATLLASNADIVTLGFGMNERGQNYTLPNVISIAQQIKAAGKDVIVIPPARTNVDNGSSTQWRKTCNLLRKAADFTQSAYVPIEHIYDDNFLGAMGISRKDHCGTNLYNHDGITENYLEGQLLVKSLGF